MSKTNLDFRDNPQWNDLQLNNVLSFYWQVLASLCLCVCSHQPCYFLLYKKANSLQIFSADKSIHFYIFWCFIFREIHMERLGMKPGVLEIIPTASANCALYYQLLWTNTFKWQAHWCHWCLSVDLTPKERRLMICCCLWQLVHVLIGAWKNVWGRWEWGKILVFWKSECRLYLRGMSNLNDTVICRNEFF